MLSSRKEAILRFLVGEYIGTAMPVGSEALVKKYVLGVSPATTRNELAMLEEDGYVSRSHPSAGCVPSDKGYRYYVQFLSDARELPVETKLGLRHRITQAEQDVEVWTQLAAQLLAETAHNMAIATFPRGGEARLRHLELVQIQEFLVLLVLVLHQARVRKQLVPLKDPVDRDALVQIANKLNAHFAGLGHRQIAVQRVELTPLEEQVLQVATRILQEEDEALYKDYFVEGLRHLLRQPEFNESGQAHEVVDLLEDRRLLGSMLVEAPAPGTFRLIIGQEHRLDALKPFSVVLAPYGVPGEAAGTIGILGPTRMEYSTTIAGVRYLASLMSELLAGVHRRASLS
ncbi:MAG: heat-inducible transcription repressor HrcA [Chloroflexi bacterium]|nr:heat-inducible transcription repressor HrcA [Chloroflexota bacterium]